MSSRNSPKANIRDQTKMKNQRILTVLFAACIAIAGCVPSATDQPKAPSDKYFVRNVIDGDTIELRNGRKVRYIGIDTPEVRKRMGGRWQYLPEPYAEDAKRHNLYAVGKKWVRLEFDEQKEDKYGRWLAYVYDDDKMINEELLKEGLATLYVIPPNDKYIELFADAQSQARAEKKGIWKDLKTIFSEDAENNAEKVRVVRGKVLAISRTKRVLVLNLSGGFNVVIFSRNLVYFEKEGIFPARDYTGKFIEVVGKIKYVDGPSMIIDHPSQITILD